MERGYRILAEDHGYASEVHRGTLIVGGGYFWKIDLGVKRDVLIGGNGGGGGAWEPTEYGSPKLACV